VSEALAQIDLPVIEVRGFKWPRRSFWTACFNSFDPVVDVDIILPAHWFDQVVEEVDLELDIVRSADSTVYVRDRDEFDRVRSDWNMPSGIASEAEATCERH